MMRYCTEWPTHAARTTRSFFEEATQRATTIRKSPAWSYLRRTLTPLSSDACIADHVEHALLTLTAEEWQAHTQAAPDDLDDDPVLRRWEQQIRELWS